MEKYIIQKAQKIVSALYLVTDLIKDNDAIKWEIREEGISFVSSALLLNVTLPGERDHANHLIVSSSDKLISFLNICLISSLISQMNASIIINEIESLVGFINKNSKEIPLPGYILSDSFFQTDALPQITKSEGTELNNSSRTINKAKESSVNKKVDVKDKKNDRQESILNLLKKDSNLTIKDFVKVIKDCSEKTIQRELISLVEKGVVKRVGERRWSTYSLA